MDKISQLHAGNWEKQSTRRNTVTLLRIDLAQIATQAKSLGFSQIGFTPVTPLERGSKALQQWLDNDYHGSMSYMAAHGQRNDPKKMLTEAKGIIVVALPYARKLQNISRSSNKLNGVIARYAQGPDYHIVLKKKLATLAEKLSTLLGCTVISRACVDTAPLLEREIAQEAGLGFIAKSTMTIIPEAGTYTLLGELLIDVELPASEPQKAKCGQCTLCLDKCPTQAFVAPYVLDARKCISYLTIESKDPIPRELRNPIGNRIFGCDICQEVCPFNASPKPRPADPELEAFEHLQFPALEALLNMRSGEYRRFVKGTALRRASRAQLGRNAAIALGNSQEESAIRPLIQALNENISPLVRGHAAWALGELPYAPSPAALIQAQQDEKDPFVLEEIEVALTNLSGKTMLPTKLSLPPSDNHAR